MMKTYKILLCNFLILMSGLGFSQSVPSYVPTNGLVGWWGFNGNAQDNSGNGNHGTVNGASLTTDRFGNQNAAYSYDGSSSIIVNDHLSLRPGHITISVWFLSSGLGTGDNALVTKTRIGDPWSSLGGEQYTLFQVLHSGVSGQLNPGLTEGGFNIKRNGNCVNGGIGWYNITQPNLLPGVSNWSNLSGVWVNLIATYDGVTMKLFKDGVLSGTFLPPPGLIDNCSGGTLNFGRYWDTRNFFNGKLDDIGIWNRALSQQEINSLYNSQLSQPCTTSVASNLNISGCGFAVLSNGDTVNQSGTYLDTLTTVLGCDSILNQIVTIQPSSTCNSIPAYVPTNGLVGWWGFNGNAQDGSGNGNHGTVNGATLTTDRFGNQNSAFNFDGVDDWIQVDDHATLRPNHITISAWIYVNTPTINSIVTKTRIGNPFGPDGGEQYCIFQSPYNYQNTAGSFQIKRNGGCQNGGVGWYRIFQTNLPFSTVQWQHIVGTYDGDTMKLYNNGLLSGFQVPPSGPIDNCSNGTFNIGRGWVNYDFYNGKMDNLGMWNRALTPQEITNLYNSQLPTQTSLCLPTITTSSPTSVGVDTVVIGGDISSDGGSSIVLRGICYSTSPNPNMGNQRTENGSGIGSFNTILRGLTLSTTYYARSYAKNSNGVVVYGNEVSFTTSASLPGVRCPGTPTVTDIDGNVYNTVQIGNQCWTQSNLKVSKYRNGDNIPTGLSNADWENTTSGAYAIYNNDPVNDGLYGKLYNHYAATDSRGLCPTGWHVPSDVEWNRMAIFLDSTADTTYSTCGFCTQSNLAGGALKDNMVNSPGSWATPNGGATNISGFTGLPGGYRGSSGVYSDIGGRGWWYTSSNYSSSLAYGRSLYYFDATLSRGHGYLSYGVSVRCLKNTLPQVNTTSVTNVTPSSALVTGEVISEGDQNTTRGFCYSTTSNPTLSNDTTMNGTGTGVYSDTLQNLTPSNTYYVRAYATNSVGTSYGTELSFTTPLPAPQPCPGTPSVTDIDGNIYNTVQIGNQCWTQSNLKTSKYRNGDSIPSGLNNSQWAAATFGAYGEQNIPGSIGSFGRLYNHFTVSDSRGLCPTGWKVPSIQEWFVLGNYLGGSQLAGGKLKDTLTQPQLFGWEIPNVGATNESGFAALGSGFKDIYGNLGMAGTAAFYWSTSPYQGRINASWIMSLFHSNAVFSDYDYTTYSENRNGFSVRCLKVYLPVVNTLSVANINQSSAMVTGEVISEGDQNSTRGFCYSTISNPTISSDTTMNGTGIGVYSDTLQNLTPSTTYYVRAYVTNSVGTSYGTELSFTTGVSLPGIPCPGTPTVTDIDGNIYNTVQIGNHCWTQSNLKTSRYRNGDTIPTGLSNSDWWSTQFTNLGAYQINYNIAHYDSIYGKLYNHYAVTDNRGICPTGWHVPSKSEFDILVYTLEPGIDTSFVGWSGSLVGGMLKSTALSPTIGGWLQPNTGANNLSGFLAIPSGFADMNGGFLDEGSTTSWWTSTDVLTYNAWYRGLSHNRSSIDSNNSNRTHGLPVRCLKN